MEALQASSMLAGGNSPWLESQYEQYLADPNSVDEGWRTWFQSLPMVHENTREVPLSQVREEFRPAELFVTEFSQVMSIHTGPGLVGLAFYNEL